MVKADTNKRRTAAAGAKAISESDQPKRIGFLDYGLVGVVCILILLRLFDVYAGNFLILAASLISLFRNLSLDARSLRMPALTLLDAAVLSTVIVDTIGLATTIYWPNSFAVFGDTLYLFLFYWLIRLNFRTETDLSIFCAFATLTGLVLAAMSLHKLPSQYSRLTSLGFADFTDFKQFIILPNPGGLITGVWIIIFLLLLPFPIILAVRCKWRLIRAMLILCIAGLFFVPLISLSRGVFIALFCFAILVSALVLKFRIVTLRKIILFALPIMLLLAIGLLPVMRSALTTATMLRTVSQVRSVEGRADIWTRSVEMVKDRPLWGAGANNFSIASGDYRESSDSPFTGAAFNSFVQLAVERGIIGFCAYVFLFLAFFAVSLKTLKRERTARTRITLILFVSAVAAVIVRELTYSSLFINKPASSLLWLIFAVSSNLQQNGTSSVTVVRKWWTLALLSVLLMFGWETYKGNRIRKAKSLHLNFVHKIQADQREAFDSIEGAVSLCPENAYYLTERALFRTRLISKRVMPPQILEGDITFNARDAQRIETAIGFYLDALELNPRDEGIYHNLGWLYYFAGQRSQALDCLAKAASMDNREALYHVSLGLLRERYGEQQEAQRDYASALREAPSLVDSMFFRDFQRRSPEQAQKLVTDALADFEGKPLATESSFLKAKSGKLYLFAGKLDRAEVLLRDALTDNPGLSRPWLNLGMIRELQGLDDDARRYYERAAFLEADQAQPLIKLGDFFYRHNDLLTAVSYYRRGIMAFLERRSARSLKALWFYDPGATVPNDVVPYDLLYYCSPGLDVAATSLRVAEFYRQRGDEHLAKEYEIIGQRLNY